jgi:predicted lipoprotein with Yx(FWY)xxD motif
VNRKMYAIALLAVGVLALLLAACGGSSSSSGSETGYESAGSKASGEGEAGGKPAKAAPNAEEGTTVVSLGDAGDLGMVLVNSQGMTLYDFRKDQGTESSCYGACEGFWPPLLTEGEPQPGDGAQASQLGTTERKDGTTQVTYAGHPLYTYVEDTKPGETTGNDIDKFGGEWYALNKDGEEPTTSGGGGTTTEESTTNGGGGYGGY